MLSSLTAPALQGRGRNTVAVQYPRHHGALFRDQVLRPRADKFYIATILIAYIGSVTIIILLLAAANHNRKTGWRSKRADPMELPGWGWTY
jgi:hypothetical protein